MKTKQRFGEISRFECQAIVIFCSALFSNAFSQATVVDAADLAENDEEEEMEVVVPVVATSTKPKVNRSRRSGQPH